MREQGKRYPDLCSTPDERPGVQSASDGAGQLEGILVCKQKLMDHILLLDGALDRRTSDRISRRENRALLQALGLPPMKAPQRRLGSGAALPDHRPVPWYLCPFEHLGDLGRSSFETVVHAGDICHCHGKRGDDVARIVEKQCSRWDLNCYDAVAGTGDGGWGE